MDLILIAFDVDGTLVIDDKGNKFMMQLLMSLAAMENTRIIVWSGGGKDYAENWVRRLGLEGYVWKVVAKSKDIKPHICFDDVESTKLADINIIVKD